MQSSLFNNLFSYYMILNYFIQPVFMIVVVFFLYRIAKHLGNIDKHNKLQSDMPEKKNTDNEMQAISDDIQ